MDVQRLPDLRIVDLRIMDNPAEPRPLRRRCTNALTSGNVESASGGPHDVKVRRAELDVALCLCDVT